MDENEIKIMKENTKKLLENVDKDENLKKILVRL
jgi:hypothetical protein